AGRDRAGPAGGRRPRGPARRRQPAPAGGRGGATRQDGPASVVGPAAVLDEATLVGALGIVVGEVDETALRVPDVLAVDDHPVTHLDRHPPPEVQVVVDQHRDAKGIQADDETLVSSGGTPGVGQDTDYRAL